MKLELSLQLSKNFMKIRPVGDELSHADRRTDMTKLTLAFRNFANAPNRVVSNVWHERPLRQ